MVHKPSTLLQTPKRKEMRENLREDQVKGKQCKGRCPETQCKSFSKLKANAKLIPMSTFRNMPYICSVQSNISFKKKHGTTFDNSKVAIL